MQRLKKRHDLHERDDRQEVFSQEDSCEFVTLLHGAFEQMKDYENVLYLQNNEIEDINKIVEWISK